MVSIKICALAIKKKKKLEVDDRQYKELKEYMYVDICPKCGASPTFQKEDDRIIYCKSCGFALDVEDCKIVDEKIRS